jgi:serine/threonine protein kinase
MPDDNFHHEDSFDVREHEKVELICTPFEEAWKRGESPEIETYHGKMEAGESARSFLITELLGLEIEYRRNRGEDPRVENYQSRFPQYAEVISGLFEEVLQSGKDTRGRSGGGTDADFDSPEPLPTSVARYKVVRLLGQGSFGRVYLAKDPELERLIAVKVSHRDLFVSGKSIARFKSEARKVAHLGKHPGIVTVHDIGQEEDQCYIVMDFLEGGTLADLRDAKQLSFNEIACLIAQVADAIHFAHTKGIIHRVIKPANILLDDNGAPNVADFGLAVHETEQSGKRGEISGTPCYMSPEQAQGRTDYLDGRTDIWSLGATLYELLTQRRPFSADTEEDLIDQIVRRDVKPPRQINDAIPEQLEEACLKALSKKPSDRHGTAHDFAKALRQAARTEQVSPLRHVGWVAAAACAVVTCALIVNWPFGGSPNRKPDSSKAVGRTSGPDAGPAVPRQELAKMYAFPEKHQSAITCIHISKSGSYAASGDRQGTVWVWNLETRKPVGYFKVSGSVWKVCMSQDGTRVASLCRGNPYVELRTVPELEPIPVTGSFSRPPETLLPGSDEQSIWALLAFENEILLRDIENENPRHSFAVSTRWDNVVAAHANGRFAVAGYLASEDQWRIKMWEPGITRNQAIDVFQNKGPICSVAVSDGGDVAFGGYGPDVGIQVCRSGERPQHLDKTMEDLYYHSVDISPDGRNVYDISRHIRSPDGEEEYALLRAWQLSEKEELVLSQSKLQKPVRASACLPEKSILLIEASRILQLWELR